MTGNTGTVQEGGERSLPKIAIEILLVEMWNGKPHGIGEYSFRT